MSTIPSHAVNISRPAPNAVSEVQVPPKAYLNFQFSLQGATSAKQGDDLVIELPDGSKVVCLGYYSNNAEGEAPQIAVNGEALPPSALETLLFTSTVEGLRPEGQTGTEGQNGPEGQTEGASGSEQAGPESSTAASTSASPSGASSTSGASTGASAGESSSSASSSSSSSSSSSGAGSTANDGGFKQDVNVDFLGGIPRLPGLDLSSDRGFEDTYIEGGSLIGNTAGSTPPPAPSAPPAPSVTPPPATVFETVTGLKEEGSNKAGAVTTPGSASASHTLTFTVPDGVDPDSVGLDFSLFPGAPTGALVPGQTYPAHYGDFSYTVTKNLVGVVDENGDPVLDADGNQLTRWEVDIELKYDNLNDTHADINALPGGGTLNENMSFTVTGSTTGGSNTTLGSANIGFVVEGSNDGPAFVTVSGSTTLVGHGEVKEEGVYNDNLLTGAGSWDNYNPATPSSDPNFGTHKNTTHVQLGVTDADRGDSHTFSLTSPGSPTVSISGAHAGKTVDLVQNPDGSYTLRIDGADCGTLTLSASGALVFTLDSNSSVIQAMQAGQASTITFNVTVTDKGGLADTGDVTLTLHGTNDRPVITVTDDAVLDITVDATTGNASAELTEKGINGSHNSVSGKLEGADVDSPGVGQTDGLKFYIATSKDVLGKAKLDMTTDVDADGNLAGKYGTLVLQPDGSFKYTENGTLGTGMQGTDRFYVLVKDSNGAFSAKELAFTVNGKDNPVVFNTNYTLSLVEEGVVKGANSDAAHVPNRPITSVTGDVTQNITDNDGVGSRTFKLVANAGAGDNALHIERETFINGVQTIYTTYGVLTLDQNTGIYTYTLNDSATVDALNKDTNLFERYKLQVIKSTDTWERDFSVNIQGSNDNPKLAVLHDLEIWEDNRLPGTSSSTAIGSDVDTDDALTYSLKNDRGEWRQVLVDDYGTMKINAATGLYTYELNDAAVQSLGQYQSYTKTFTVRVFDENGAWAEQQVTVTIHGTLDAPTISYSTPTVLEDNGLLTANGDPITTGRGSISVGAVDTVHKDGQQFSLVKANGGEPEVIGGSGTELIIKGLYGTLVFNTSDGSYTYTLDATINASEAMQKMNVGELFGQEKFTVRVTFSNDKDSGGTAYSKDAELVIDIKGTNDVPIFVGADTVYDIDITRTSPLSAPPSTPPPSSSDAKQATATDVDNDSYQQAGNKSELTFCFKVGDEYVQTIETTYGTVTINNITGVYEYTLNNQHPDILKLAAGQATTDKFYIWVRDPHGEEAQREVNVTINGASFDGETPPSYELPSLDLVVKEDSEKDKTEHDRDDPNDVDKADPGKWDESPTGSEISPEPGTPVRYCFVNSAGEVTMSLQGKYGTIYIDAVTGQYRYVLDNMHSEVQGLGQNERVTETFNVHTYTYTAGTGTGGTITDAGAVPGGNITVTIKGVNDDPTLVDHQQAGSLHAYVGTSGLTTSGEFNVKDADKSDTHTFSLSGDGLVSVGDTLTFEWGSVTIDDTGKYIFTYAPEAGKILAGDTAIKFYVHVFDGTSWAKEEVTVNIIAKNVAPIVVSCIYGTDGSYVYGDTANPDLSINTGTGDVLLDGNRLDATTAEDLTAGIKETTAGITGKFGAWDHEVAEGVKPDASLKFYLVGADGTLVNFMESAYGTLEMQPDGTFIFTLNVNATEVKGLQHDQKFDLDYKVVVRDANGAESAPQDFVLTITGTNNQPNITFGGNFTFDESSADVQEKGFTLTDPDIKPTGPNFGFTVTGSSVDEEISGVVVSDAAVSDAGGLKQYTFTLTGMLNGVLVNFGELVIQMNPANLNDSANMKYWFDLDNDIIDKLAAGSNVNFKLNISFNDGAGVTASGSTSSTSNNAEIGITIQGRPGTVPSADTAADDGDGDATASLSLAVHAEDGTHLVDSIALPAPLAVSAASALTSENAAAALGHPDTALPGAVPAPLVDEANTHGSGPAQPLTLETPLADAPHADMTSAPGQEALQFQLQTTGV